MERINVSARWFTHRGVLTLLALFAALTLSAQTAQQVLDKTAAVVSAKQGTQLSFTIKGEHMKTSGTIAIKGRKFHATIPQATIWFDGKTQWTYLKKSEEVNIATPSESELAAINPYNFINIYEQGYQYSMVKKGTNFIVHLTAKDQKRGIQEMYITVNQKTYIPSQIRMKQQKSWTTIDISNFKAVSLADGIFRFNAKDFPQAEVIDLR